MAFIKSISTVENTQRWEVTYERDFTIGSLSKDYRSSIAAYTVAGDVGTADWVGWSNNGTLGDNQNHTTAMQFNSSGMQIAPATNASFDSTNFYNVWTNAPRIVAPLDELVPGPSGIPKMVCIQLYADANRTFAQDYEFMGLCLALNAQQDSSNMFAMGRTIYDSTVSAQSVRGAAASTTAGLGTQPNYFEMILYPGLNQTRIAVGTWTGEFPAPGRVHTLSDYQSNYLACGNLTAANTYIGMGCSTATFTGTATAFTATAKKIRVSTLSAIDNASKGITSCV